MSRYRRLFVSGGTYFFTVKLADGDETTLIDQIDDLRACYGRCAASHPFATRAIVVLPDHIHAVWTLPDGDADFSGRWKRIKAGFARQVGGRPRSASKLRKGEAGVWQRRFWEHLVRDEAELSACLRYVWSNPVKHGLVERAVDWPYSSLHREIRAGPMPEGGV
ncbi:REP-associated tyrosine transposase [Jannaschia seohaensis]|uniref:Putative transposase n=1 Tax=Jannaschia seohaensis TaxID=475081 RepID=A0A2Y9B2J2_9RHOB|nr:transposase [Jannaschia seohaensis]PWJ13340.1 putative transposase [Jannaschia seohaensis]SSA50666.1 putative transposase [Jannaschia seohaensis]